MSGAVQDPAQLFEKMLGFLHAEGVLVIGSLIN